MKILDKDGKTITPDKMPAKISSAIDNDKLLLRFKDGVVAYSVEEIEVLIKHLQKQVKLIKDAKTKPSDKQS